MWKPLVIAICCVNKFVDLVCFLSKVTNHLKMVGGKMMGQYLGHGIPVGKRKKREESGTQQALREAVPPIIQQAGGKEERNHKSR